MSGRRASVFSQVNDSFSIGIYEAVALFFTRVMGDI